MVQRVISLRDYHWYICFRAITRIWHFIQFLLMIIFSFHFTCLYNTFARNCEENYWMFTEKYRRCEFQKKSFTCHNVWQQQQDHKVFHGLLHHQTRKKKHAIHCIYIWLNTLSLELQRNNKQNKKKQIILSLLGILKTNFSPAEAYPGLWSMMQCRVLLLPPRWDSSPLQVTPPQKKTPLTPISISSGFPDS